VDIRRAADGTEAGGGAEEGGRSIVKEKSACSQDGGICRKILFGVFATRRRTAGRTVGSSERYFLGCSQLLGGQRGDTGRYHKKPRYGGSENVSELSEIDDAEVDEGGVCR
jgi:hypothetical protein